ncbi:MAG: hypothetical protein JKY37_10365, partial [Nannocystaceae bacterium]|nr:hypothetical protein [Nannocystaceae bacterium]
MAAIDEFSTRLLWVSLALTLTACVAAETGDGDGGTADSGGSTADGPTACEPGVAIACACVEGPDGAQTCLASGAAYGACDCGGEPGTTSNSAGSQGAGSG